MSTSPAVADGKKSALEIVILLFAGGVGTGVLVLPRAMSAVGFMAMLACLICGSLLSAATTWMLFMGVTHARKHLDESLQKPLIVVVEDGQNAGAREDDTAELNQNASLVNGPSYGELLTMATAPCMSMVLDVMLLIYAGGAIVTYYLFIADFVQRLPCWPSALTLNKTVVLLAGITYPLTLYRNVGKLAKLANVVVVVLFFMTLGIWCRAPAAAANRKSPVLAFDDLEASGSVLCICIYAFVWHNNCVSISRELRNPTPIRCAGIALGATTLLCTVYFIIALGGYLSWGTKLLETGSIIDVYDINDPLFIVLRLALTASLLVAIGLNIFPLRESCCSLVRKVAPNYMPSSFGHASWSLGIILAAAGTAILNPGVTKDITILGGTIGPCMCIIFPVVISKMVLSRAVWLLAVMIAVPISVFLNLSALGIIGEAV